MPSDHSNIDVYPELTCCNLYMYHRYAFIAVSMSEIIIIIYGDIDSEYTNHISKQEPHIQTGHAYSSQDTAPNSNPSLHKYVCRQFILRSLGP